VHSWAAMKCVSQSSLEAVELARRWPYCYHVTFSENLRSIVDSRALFSASTLLTNAGLEGHGRLRASEQTIEVSGRLVVLRNQIALNPDELELSDKDTLEEYVSFLNQRTYFWPGTDAGPVADGLRLIAAHGALRPPIVIRTRTLSLIEENRNQTIQVATFNTGASWRLREGKSWRARDAVVPLAKYADDPGAIAELSYLSGARLPRDCEYSTPSHEGWHKLF